MFAFEISSLQSREARRTKPPVYKETHQVASRLACRTPTSFCSNSSDLLPDVEQGVSLKETERWGTTAGRRGSNGHSCGRIKRCSQDFTAARYIKSTMEDARGSIDPFYLYLEILTRRR